MNYINVKLTPAPFPSAIVIFNPNVSRQFITWKKQNEL